MQQIGPYLLESKLGEGGMGAVFRARHAAGGHVVALKLLRRELISAEGSFERFRREAQAMARISHPHVVRIYEQGEDAQVAWIALELIEGESLDERLRREGALSAPEAVELLVDLCEGLEAAHDRGVLHRDLKPANVLIRASDGRPLLTDFGLARASGASQQLTHTGEILGTPSYMPPEQAGLAYDVSPAADVYGLGAILYAALSGCPPFQAASVLQVLDKVLNQPPERPSLLRGEPLPAQLEELCLRCLAKDPSQRPPTPLALRRALSNLDLTRSPARSPRSLLGLGLLGAVFAAGAGLSLALQPGPQPSPTPAALAGASPAGTPGPSSTQTPPAQPTLAPSPPAASALEQLYLPLWPAAVLGPAPAWALELEQLSAEEQLARIEALAETDDADLRFQLLALESEIFVRPCVQARNPPPPSEALLRRGHRLFRGLTRHAREAELKRPPDAKRVELVRLFRGRLSFALGQIKENEPSLAYAAALQDLDRAWRDLRSFHRSPPAGRFGRMTLAYSFLALLGLSESATSQGPSAALGMARTLQDSRPEWALGYVAEARALAAHGLSAQAQEVAARGLSRVGEDERCLLLLWQHAHAHERGEAVDFARLERAVRLTRRPGERLVAFLELCSALAEERPAEVPAALARLDAFLAELPDRAWGAIEAAGMRAQVEAPERALLAATEALRREPPSPLKRAQLLGLRARAHRALGHEADAREDVRAALALRLAPAALLLELEASLAEGDRDQAELALFRLWCNRAAPGHRKRARRLVQDALGEEARPLLEVLMAPLDAETPARLRRLPEGSPLRLLYSLHYLHGVLGRPASSLELLEPSLRLVEQALAAELPPQLVLELRLRRAQLCALALTRRGGARARWRALALEDVRAVLPHVDAHRRAELRVAQADLVWGTVRGQLGAEQLLRAEEVLRAWHRESPLAPEPVGPLASCLNKLGRAQEAIRLLSEFQGLTTPSWPQRGKLDLLQAGLLRETGRYRRAASVGRAATALPNADPAERLRSIVELTRTLLVYGPDPPLHPLQVSASGMRFLPELTGEEPAAAQLAFEVPFVHARALGHAGKPEASLSVLLECERKAVQTEWLALVESERANALISLGQQGQALQRLERAIELAGLAAHRLARAALLIDLDRRDEARAELGRVDPAQLRRERLRVRYSMLAAELKAARPAD